MKTEDNISKKKKHEKKRTRSVKNFKLVKTFHNTLMNEVRTTQLAKKMCSTSPAISNAANHSSENGTAFDGGFIRRVSCFLSFPDFLQHSKPELSSSHTLLNN